MPGRGELDGIAEQVDEHLAQTTGIAQQVAGNVGRNDTAHRQPLGERAGRHNVERIADLAVEVERDVFQIDVIGIKLCDVQHVVNELQEMCRGIAGDLGVALLHRVKLGARNQVDNADNAAQRSPDFMAHGGKEGGAGMGRRFRLVAGILKRDAGLYARGDIIQRFHETTIWQLGRLHLDGPAVGQ